MTAVTRSLNQSRIVDTFLGLVRIDSPSGQEAALATQLISELEQLGLEVRRDGAGNVVGHRDGRGGGAGLSPLLLSAHMDTVQPGCAVQPQVQDGTIRTDGRTILGADDKAGLTTILEALRHADEWDLPCRPLEVAFTVEEETGLTGAKRLDMSRFHARHALVLDSGSTVGTIVNRAPAQNAIDALVHGRAAHAGVAPELGVNAIQAVARALAPMKLGRIDEETTANVGVISGGTASNVVPDRVHLKGEARSRDEGKLDRQTEHMVQLLRAAAEAEGGSADVKVHRSYSALNVPETSPLIKLLVSALQACGLQPQLVPTGGGSDANVLNAAGLSAVNLGLGYADAHSVDEHIAVADLVKACEVVLAVLTLDGSSSPPARGTVAGRPFIG